MKIDNHNELSNENVEISYNKHGVNFYNPNYFLVFSDFNISDGIDIVENILVLQNKAIDLDNTDDLFKSIENFMENNQLNGSYIFHNLNNVKYFINTYDDISVITVLTSDIVVEDYYNNLKVLNSPKGFENAKIDFGQIVIINKALSPKVLIRLHSEANKERIRFFESLNLPYHIDNIIGYDDFLALAANMKGDDISDEEIEFGVDINRIDYDEDYDYDDLAVRVTDAVSIALECAYEKSSLSVGILDYFVSLGIQISDLIDTAIELMDCEKTEEIKETLELELYNILEDEDVVSLLIAAFRMEFDISNGNIREVNDIDNISTSQILGLVIANQIGGNKAVVNFNAYDFLKPGIIRPLGPVYSDAFAGLIAGLVTKVFN
ncbi:phosphatidylglycerophosphatase [uncultured Methanobrevibacter sp.]|uniref:phosphatidylglycerophosphatase n=1 Tax=uncultured Methanobrevibacter sp. TaxID=253161 RepID=UPI0025EBF6AC|nr:phosphatidylglycerophosphatase [uncultured Methanobrevibacter sp.]